MCSNQRMLFNLFSKAKFQTQKLKVPADDNFEIIMNEFWLSEKVENVMGNKEIAR